MRSIMNSRLFLITFVVAISALVAKVEANDEKALPRNELAYRLLQKLHPNEVNSFDNLTTEQEIFYVRLLDLRYSVQQSLYYSMNDSNNEVLDQLRLSGLLFYRECQRVLGEIFHKQEPSLKRKLSEILRFLAVIQQQLRDSIMHQRQLAEGEADETVFLAPLLAEELEHSAKHEGQLRSQILTSIRDSLERLNTMLQ